MTRKALEVIHKHPIGHQHAMARQSKSTEQKGTTGEEQVTLLVL